MKIKKKIMIIIASVFLILGTIFPKQNDEKVEAFALTSIALTVGALATLAVGGYIVSQDVTLEYGETIIDRVTNAGYDIRDFIVEKAIQGAYYIHANQVMNDIINETTQPVVNIVDNIISRPINKVQASPIRDNEFINEAVIVSPKSMYSTISVGDTINMSFTLEKDIDYPVVFNFYIGREDFRPTNAVNPNDVYSARLSYPEGVKAGKINFNYQVTEWAEQTYDLTHREVYTGLIATPYYIGDGEYAHEFEYDNPFSVTDYSVNIIPAITTPEQLDMARQFADVPTSAIERDQSITSQLPVGKTISTRRTNDITGVTSISDITYAEPDIIEIDDIDTEGDEEGYTGWFSGLFTVLTNIFNFIVAIPDLIAEALIFLFEMVVNAISGLSGAISGMFGSLMSMLGGISSAISNIVNTIYSVTSQITSSISDVINSVTNSVWDISLSIWDTGESIITGIGTSIGSAVTTTVDTITELGTNVISGLGDILSSMLNTVIDAYNAFDTWSRTFANSIADAVVGIVVPTDTMLNKIKTTFNELRAEFLLRFEFITVPIKSISTVFSSPKSLYDLNIEILNEKVHVMPRTFESAINYARPIFSGVIVLITIIGIYKKVTVKEVV